MASAARKQPRWFDGTRSLADANGFLIFTVEEEEDQLLERGAGHRRRHQQPRIETSP